MAKCMCDNSNTCRRWNVTKDKPVLFSLVPNQLFVVRGEAIMLVILSIFLFSNSHYFTYYAHRFYILFSKLMLIAFQTVNNILLTK